MVFDEKAYNKAYQREYHQRPEVKARTAFLRSQPKSREWQYAYNRKPEVKARFREYDRKRRSLRKAYMRAYLCRYVRNRRKTDKKFYLLTLLRANLVSRLNKNGEKKSRKLAEYGIDANAIFDRIGARPDGGYDLDHIIPCAAFDFSNLEEIKKCYAPENLQWLLSIENRRKGAKMP